MQGALLYFCLLNNQQVPWQASEESPVKPGEEATPEDKTLPARIYVCTAHHITVLALGRESEPSILLCAGKSSQHSPGPWHTTTLLQTLPLLLSPLSPRRKHQYLHFTDEETEVQGCLMAAEGSDAELHAAQIHCQHAALCFTPGA